ncbi:MAG: DUF2851 family protein [Flavobacteriales bacterium]|nr:DUF2851 family protein [Flavobacteriales bacterium]
MLNEELISQFWLNAANLSFKLSDHRSLEILFPGIKNTDAGPDFSQAILKIDSQKWCGNVEIHINEKDWFLHKHHLDKAYDNIILHVVWRADCLERIAPTLVLSEFLTDKKLKDSSRSLKCQEVLTEVETIFFSDYLEDLVLNRMQRSINRIVKLNTFLNNDWFQTVFVILSGVIGGPVNKDAFEMLAKSVSLKRALKYQNADEVELLLKTLITGQKNRVLFLKYGVDPDCGISFKNHRMRPSARPVSRTKLFPLLIQKISVLSSEIFRPNYDLKRFLNFYNTSRKELLANGWSAALIDSLFINAIVPLKLSFAQKLGHKCDLNFALRFLNEVKIEENKIVTNWRKLRYFEKTAVQSQGLIELNNLYCKTGNCRNCRIGKHYLKDD